MQQVGRVIAPIGGIYLDHHATTPVDQRVTEAIVRHLMEDFGNANSVDHVHGERAAAALREATMSVARLLSAQDDDVHFTSGSTQAIEFALSHAIGVAGGRTLRIAMSRVEHPALIDVARRAERLGLASIRWLDVSSDASVDLDDVKRALPKLDLLCLMVANNEVGTIYPVREAYDLAASAGVAMLVDATQAVGRVEMDLSETPFDYLVLSAHKLYGPKGVGALVSPVYRAEDAFGLAGGHPPTPNVPGIVGLGVACELMATQGTDDERRVLGLRDLMLHELRTKVPDLVPNGGGPRLAGNLHVSAPGAPNDLVVARLRGQVSISTGAACMSGAFGGSHVLQAMGLPTQVQESALRIGLGRSTTREDVLDAAERIASAIGSVRRSLEHRNA